MTQLGPQIDSKIDLGRDLPNHFYMFFRILDFEQPSIGFAQFSRFHPPQKAPENIKKHDCEEALETTQPKHTHFS